MLLKRILCISPAYVVSVVFTEMKELAVLFCAILAALLVSHASCESLQQARERRQRYLLQQEQTWHGQLRAREKTAYLQLPREPSVEPTDPVDVKALEALYTATNGDKWNNNTGWMKGDPCQDLWHGLYCLYGRVLQINLVINQMTGYLPPDIANMDKLQVLRLYNNFLSGRIPPEMFSMQSLQVLDLEYNIFNETLPATISMPSVTELVFYHNKLTGPLPVQWNTPKLQILEISTNTFTGPLPESLGDLKDLKQLVVSRNKLSGTFPTSFGYLTNLEQLWLFMNPFEDPTIPSSWSGMTKLTNVQMDGVSGELPAFIGDSWRSLQILGITGGGLTGEFPTSFCNLYQIQNLRLFNNSLTGQLPSCICDLHTVQDFEMSDNHLTGPIPSCIGDMSALTSLYLSRNQMSGTLPPSVGDLRKLTLIDISSNGFFGPVPSSIADWENVMVEFSLCYNKFSSIENGLENFFSWIKNYGCELYSNPWSCPLPSYVPAHCGAQCSQCNTGAQHTYCSECVKDQRCGWCNEGPNCLDGTASGPDNIYQCAKSDWSFGTSSQCH